MFCVSVIQRFYGHKNAINFSFHLLCHAYSFALPRLFNYFAIPIHDGSTHVVVTKSIMLFFFFSRRDGGTEV